MRSGKIPKTSVTEMGREKSWHRAKACGGHKQLAEQTPEKKAARPSPPLAQRRPQGCRSAPVVLAAARAAGRWWEQTGHVSAASCALPLQALGGREAARLAPTTSVGEHPGRVATPKKSPGEMRTKGSAPAPSHTPTWGSTQRRRRAHTRAARCLSMEEDGALRPHRSWDHRAEAASSWA